MVKSGSGISSGRICFTNPATSGSGRISQKQIRYSPSINPLEPPAIPAGILSDCIFIEHPENIVLAVA